MLALLEHRVSDRHGTYVMEDTDSMAIVATENGGFVPCPGGSFEMLGGGSGRPLLNREKWRASIYFGGNTEERNSLRAKKVKPQ